MEAWRRVWRDGIASVLSSDGLHELLQALKKDDPRLIQGATTVPPPLMCVQDYEVEAADAIVFCFWMGDGLETVGECEEAFARTCFECDQRLGEPAGCRHWLNYWDEAPRKAAFDSLIPEVERELTRREDMG